MQHSPPHYVTLLNKREKRFNLKKGSENGPYVIHMESLLYVVMVESKWKRSGGGVEKKWEEVEK